MKHIVPVQILYYNEGEKNIFYLFLLFYLVTENLATVLMKNGVFAEYTVGVGVYCLDCIVYEVHKTLLKLFPYVDTFSAGQSSS